MPTIARATALAFVVFAALTLEAAPQARADADPASDFLIVRGIDTYLPQRPSVPASVAAEITDLAKRSRKAGFPVKVAVIANPSDLGGIPELFGKPDDYATFLAREIAFAGVKDPLLIVMPAGFGTHSAPTRAKGALRNLAAPKTSDPGQLTKDAMVAIARMATAAGHPLAEPKSGGGGSSGALVLLAAPLLLALAAVAIDRRRRSRKKQGS